MKILYSNTKYGQQELDQSDQDKEKLARWKEMIENTNLERTREEDITVEEL